MRLWTIHPSCLDTQGLIALWRESLLAKAVLEDKTIGYRNHPQLIRFRNTKNPLESINFYLSVIFEESLVRGYQFNTEKFTKPFNIKLIDTNKGQVDFEIRHLKLKLEQRDVSKLIQLNSYKVVPIHPLFSITEGEQEAWEKN